MSRPAVALPDPDAWAPLRERVVLASSAEGLSDFDILAHGQAVEAALQLALDHASTAHALVLASAEPPQHEDLRTRLGELTSPALVLFGTRDGAPPEAGRRWRALLPDCHLMFVYDAGADIAADRPEALADIVLDFLSDPGGFLVNRRDGALNR